MSSSGKFALEKYDNLRKSTSKIFCNLFDEEVVLILSFIGGYVDATGYLKLKGLFTSSITGNLVAACASVYQTQGVLARFFVSLFFTIAGSALVAIALKLKISEEWKPRSVSILMFLFEIAALVVAMVLGLNFDHSIKLNDSYSDWRLVLVASVLGAAMGFHNAAAKETIPNCPATTVMTMTLVAVSAQFTNTVFYLLATMFLINLFPKSKGKPDNYKESIESKYKETKSKFFVTFRPLVWFLIGALIGTVLTYHITYWSIFLPIALAFIIVIDMYASILKESIEEDAKKMRELEIKLEIIEENIHHNVPPNEVPSSENDSSKELSSAKQQEVELISHHHGYQAVDTSSK